MYIVQIDVARKYQNSDRLYGLSLSNNHNWLFFQSEYLQGWGELPDTTIFPTLGQRRMGHTRDISAVDVMSKAASAWPLEKTTQSPNTKSLRWWLCSCHESEQVRSVQKTNLQTIPSKLWGDISRGFFLLLLLKCMKGQCLGLRTCSEEQQFTSGCALLCSCAQARGSRAWTGSLCH